MWPLKYSPEDCERLKVELQGRLHDRHNRQNGCVPCRVDPVDEEGGNSHRSREIMQNRQQNQEATLAAFKDLPHEIFLETIKWLQPLDLLHMSRVSKEFRALLTSRRSRHIWANARKNIGVMPPPYPPELSEIQFASFIFEPSCTFCLRSLQLHGRWLVVNFGLSIHFCKDCWGIRELIGDSPNCTLESERHLICQDADMVS
ncbi:hypothetical protein K474DRAFT_291765 [Panus rudis PR-1116 ss-1]|nr:hypothetical protein K474DRAFT_291765 [Panus rudis PR-1116 ss-1]